MEKIYIAPEFEVLKCVFIADALEPSTESSLTSQTDEPILPSGPEIPDF